MVSGGREGGGAEMGCIARVQVQPRRRCVGTCRVRRGAAHTHCAETAQHAASPCGADTSPHPGFGCNGTTR